MVHALFYFEIVRIPTNERIRSSPKQDHTTTALFVSIINYHYFYQSAKHIFMVPNVIFACFGTHRDVQDRPQKALARACVCLSPQDPGRRTPACALSRPGAGQRRGAR